MHTRFVIITKQRSGSNLLVSLLNSHKDVVCFGELFRHFSAAQIKQLHDKIKVDSITSLISYKFKKIIESIKKIVANDTIEKKSRVKINPFHILPRLDRVYLFEDYRFDQYMAYVDAVFNTAPKSAQALGFKLHLHQNRKALLGFVADPDMKLIVLERENKLAQYSSQLIAKKTGQGSAPVGKEVQTATVEFQVEDFERYLARDTKAWTEVRSALSDNGKPYFMMEYTDLLHKDTATEMLNHLGISPHDDLIPGTLKRNSSTILSRFSNPDIAEKQLKNMGLERWAHEEMR